MVVLSNDQIAIGSHDGTIKLIDLEDNNKTRTKEMAHYVVTCLLQLSNGDLISSGEDIESSSTIYCIKVWNVSDLTLLQHFITGHSKSIYSLNITEDETLLASGGEDNTIKLWPISV